TTRFLYWSLDPESTARVSSPSGPGIASAMTGLLEDCFSRTVLACPRFPPLAATSTDLISVPRYPGVPGQTSEPGTGVHHTARKTSERPSGVQEMPGIVNVRPGRDRPPCHLLRAPVRRSTTVITSGQVWRPSRCVVPVK